MNRKNNSLVIILALALANCGSETTNELIADAKHSASVQALTLTSCMLQDQQTQGFTTYNQAGDGTLESPWEIYTPQQLISISQHPGALPGHYVQCRELDLNGLPQFKIGQHNPDNMYSSFRGSYDGRGHAIKNYKYSQIPTGADKSIGLFASVNGNVVLKNITMENVEIQPTSGNYDYYGVAALVGLAGTHKFNSGTIANTANLTVSNVTLKNSRIQGSGLIGSVTNAHEIIIEHVNVINTELLEGPFQQGGVIGYNYDTDTTTISDLDVSIIKNGTSNSLFGTIAGPLYNATVSKTRANLLVSATTLERSIGGIAASLCSTTVDHVTVTADVQAESLTENSKFGGITATSLCGDVKISKVKTNVKVINMDRIGGILGKGVFSDKTSIEWSYADVNLKGHEGVGGLVGYMEDFQELTITNSYSKGKIYGDGAVGGLVGYSWNTGFSHPDKLIVAKSYSKALVRGNNANATSVGGLFGLVFKPQNSALAQDSYYTSGMILGSNQVGQIYGGIYITAPIPTPLSGDHYVNSIHCYPTQCNNVGSSFQLNDLFNMIDTQSGFLSSWEFGSDKWQRVLFEGLTIPDAGAE